MSRIRFSSVLLPPTFDRAASSSAVQLLDAIRERADVAPLGPGEAASRRTVLHLARPEDVRLRENRNNVLVCLRNRPNGISRREAWVLRSCSLRVFFSQDQAAAWGSAGDVVVRAAPGPDFLAVDQGRDRLRGQVGRPLRFLWLGAMQRDEWELVGHAWRQVVPDDAVGELATLTVRAPRPVGQPGGPRAHGRGLTVDDRPVHSDAEQAALLADHDVLVATQTGGDGLGVPALEAQAAGCLLVAPPRGTLRQAVEGGGILVQAPSDLGATLCGVVAGWGTKSIDGARQAGCRSARARTWGEAASRILSAMEANLWGRPAAAAAAGS